MFCVENYFPNCEKNLKDSVHDSVSMSQPKKDECDKGDGKKS